MIRVKKKKKTRVVKTCSQVRGLWMKTRKRVLLGKGVVIQGMNEKMIQSKKKIRKQVYFCLKRFSKPSIAHYFLADRHNKLIPGPNPYRLYRRWYSALRRLISICLKNVFFSLLMEILSNNPWLWESHRPCIVTGAWKSWWWWRSGFPRSRTWCATTSRSRTATRSWRPRMCRARWVGFVCDCGS